MKNPLFGDQHAPTTCARRAENRLDLRTGKCLCAAAASDLVIGFSLVGEDKPTREAIHYGKSHLTTGPARTLRNLGPQGCVGLPSMEDGYDGEVQPSAER